MRFKEVITDQHSPYSEVVWDCEDYGDYFKLTHDQLDKWQMVRKDSEVFKLKEVRSGFKFKIGNFVMKIYRG